MHADLKPAALRLGIITASTRPNRRGPMVADWVVRQAEAKLAQRAVTVVPLDVKDFDLPLLDEPVPAAIGGYKHEHTKRWAQTIAGLDGFVIVTPEYNHSMPASLKNAVDFLFAEWNDKAVGFVGYGIDGGTRAVEHARLVMAEVKVAAVRSQVALGLFTDFAIDDPSKPGQFTPGPHREDVLGRMLDELVDWAGALKTLRPGN
ncbi:MAG: NADPH-dependent FMN reductase [Mycobacterium sp.]